MAPSFSLREYFALHLYLACLLVGSLLFLPRSSRWFPFWSSATPAHASSLDRPEHPFLTPLTASPARTMSWFVLGEMVIMMWWGQHLQVWAADKDARPADRDVRMRNLAHRLVETCAATAAGALVLAVLMVLLGSPLSQILLTTLLGLHLSLLLVWPVVHCLGVPSIHDDGLLARYRLTKLVCALDATSPMERALVYPLAGTALGAWSGAAFLLLDWDRPWQSFPLPPTVGSIVGFLVGGFVSWGRSAIESLLTDISIETSETAKDTTRKPAPVKSASRKKAR